MTTFGLKNKGLRILPLGLLLCTGMLAQAQNVGINTTGAAGHTSAMLDVSAGNKGVLFPNVTLTGATDAVTIATPAKGLLVWNTGASWGTAGFYYNDGSTGSPNWLKVATGNTSISHTLSNPANTITSTVNGVVATASAVNTVSNTSTTNTLSTTVNGVAGTGVNIINSNSLTWTKSGNVASAVNGVSSTVTVASGTVADVLGYNASGAPVYESLSSVVKEPWYQENSTTPANANSQNIYQNAKVGIGNFSAGQTFNTGSPVATLEVTGASASLRVGPRYDAGGDRDYVDVISDGTSSKVSTANEDLTLENISAGTLTLKTNGSNRLQIASGGAVTINSLSNGLVKTASGVLSNATAGTDYQAPMSAGTGISIASNTITNTGVTSLAGTANQVNVSAGTGSITLSTPQNIHTGASPTFAGATLTGLSTAGIVTNTAGGVLGTSTVASLMADLTPGAGLSGTTIYDGSSAQTFSVASGNGLTTDAGQDRVKLGGSLDENTTIGKGNFGLTLNQTGTGDFDIQDNGATSLFVYGNDGAATDGNVGIGTNTPASKLQVIGSVFIPSGQSYWIGNNGDSGDRLRLHQSGTAAYIDYATGDLNFRAGTTPKIIFQNDGDLQVNNLAGTGDRLVTADANGVLGTKENSMWAMSANFGSSPDDLTGGDITADGADDNVYVRNLGFSVVINGVSYSQVSVCTNGWIAFGNIGTTSYAAEPLPSGLFTTPVIFPYWTDLKDFGSGEWIREYSFSNNVYVLEWRLRAYTGGSTNWVVRFQVQIHKSGLINVKYYDPMQPQMNGQQHTIDGVTRNATIGFQLDGGVNARFHQISYNAKVLDDNNEISEGWSVSPVR